MSQTRGGVLDVPQTRGGVSGVPPAAGVCQLGPPDPRPIIKWSTVSKFKIRDIPEPQQYPTYGCSEDPSLYETIWEDCVYRGSHFTNKSCPFGSMPGYLTDMGVVKVPEKGFYGFKWAQIDHRWGWVLSTTQDTFQNRGSGSKDRKGESRGRKKKRKNAA